VRLNREEKEDEDEVEEAAAAEALEATEAAATDDDIAGVRQTGQHGCAAHIIAPKQSFKIPCEYNHK